MTRDQQTLASAAKILRSLNLPESQWLRETADSLDQIGAAFPALKRMAKKENRLVEPAGVPPGGPRDPFDSIDAPITCKECGHHSGGHFPNCSGVA